MFKDSVTKYLFITRIYLIYLIILHALESDKYKTKTIRYIYY